MSKYSTYGRKRKKEWHQYNILNIMSRVQYIWKKNKESVTSVQYMQWVEYCKYGRKRKKEWHSTCFDTQRTKCFIYDWALKCMFMPLYTLNIPAHKGHIYTRMLLCSSLSLQWASTSRKMDPVLCVCSYYVPPNILLHKEHRVSYMTKLLSVCSCSMYPGCFGTQMTPIYLHSLVSVKLSYILQCACT